MRGAGQIGADVRAQLGMCYFNYEKHFDISGYFLNFAIVEPAGGAGCAYDCRIEVNSMQYIIKAPRRLNASIQLPASKSISNRALIINALAGGDVHILNLSDCDDTSVMITALRDHPDVVDIKAAGTAMRFLTAFFSVGEGEHTITGTERMKRRPIGILVEALRTLGADISYLGEEGFPPLRVKGRALDGGKLEIPANVSSQFISALLMIGPMMRHGLELRLKGVMASRPYIDLTLCMMREFGAKAEWSDVDVITVSPQVYSAPTYSVESDWTAASYWYEMMALADDVDSCVRLGGLMDGSRQGDSVIRYIFSMLGVKTSFIDKQPNMAAGVELSRHLRTLPRLDYDFSHSPDLAQTLVVACVAMGIPFHFTGLATLKVKETDRMLALQRELRKLGFVLREDNDSELIWNGERCEPTFEAIDTYEDHRMAMAFAPLALVLPEVKINDPEVVSKSYPHFWADLKTAGFEIEEMM